MGEYSLNAIYVPAGRMAFHGSGCHSRGGGNAIQVKDASAAEIKMTPFQKNGTVIGKP